MLYTNYLERYSNFFTYAKANLKSVYSTKHEVVMPDSGETSVDIARASWVDKPGVILGGGLIILKPKDIIFPGFLAYSLTYGKNHKDIASKAQGKSVVHIHSKDLANLKFFFPKNIVTQRKICNLLEEVNTYISLQQRKLDQLKLVHKGLLHQLLKHNATWKEVKIKEILNVRNKQIFPNESYPLMSFVQNKGVIPKGKRYNRDFLVKGSKKYKMTEIGDFIYSSNNLETGSIGINKTGKAVISPVYSIFSSKNHDESQFIGLLAEDNAFIYKMLKYRQGVVYGQWKIPEKDFLNIQIKIPNLKTRERILALFTNLDNLFNQEKGKLNYLKRVKKFLLQNMFI